MERTVADISDMAMGIFVGSVLLAAGIEKARDFRGAWIGVLDYRLVPAGVAAPVAALQVGIEILLGTALVLDIQLALPLAILLLASFSVAGVLALVRGLDIDCHCVGDHEPLTIATVGRNVGFILLLTVALVTGAGESPLAPHVLEIDPAAALCLGLLAAGALVLVAAARYWVSARTVIRRRHAN